MKNMNYTQEMKGKIENSVLHEFNTPKGLCLVFCELLFMSSLPFQASLL